MSHYTIFNNPFPFHFPVSSGPASGGGCGTFTPTPYPYGQTLYQNPATHYCIISDDLVTLGCVMYRLKAISDNQQFLDINTDSNKMIELITPGDRALAEQIKYHYLTKINFAILRGEELSPFRRDLHSLLTHDFLAEPKQINAVTGKISEKYQYPIDLLGMAYKLPYFYYYDLGLREIFQGDYATLAGPSRYDGIKTLNFLKKLVTNKKSLTMGVEYWFLDLENNTDRVCLTIDKKNPLLKLFDNYVTAGDIQVNSKFVKQTRDKMEFYLANFWELV